MRRAVQHVFVITVYYYYDGDDNNNERLLGERERREEGKGIIDEDEDEMGDEPEAKVTGSERVPTKRVVQGKRVCRVRKDDLFASPTYPEIDIGARIQTRSLLTLKPVTRSQTSGSPSLEEKAPLWLLGGDSIG
ncbi:hypothetical protein B7463_g8752, partial [Scytalidium lignicola]